MLNHLIGILLIVIGTVIFKTDEPLGYFLILFGIPSLVLGYREVKVKAALQRSAEFIEKNGVELIRKLSQGESVEQIIDSANKSNSVTCSFARLYLGQTLIDAHDGKTNEFPNLEILKKDLVKDKPKVEDELTNIESGILVSTEENVVWGMTDNMKGRLFITNSYLIFRREPKVSFSIIFSTLWKRLQDAPFIGVVFIFFDSVFAVLRLFIGETSLRHTLLKAYEEGSVLAVSISEIECLKMKSKTLTMGTREYIEIISKDKLVEIGTDKFTLNEEKWIKEIIDLIRQLAAVNGNFIKI